MVDIEQQSVAGSSEVQLVPEKIGRTQDFSSVTLFAEPTTALPKSTVVLDDCLIDFDGPNDPERPLNWPMRKKIVITALYAFCTMFTTWASSIFNFGLSQLQPQFHIGEEVALLGTSLYLAGNAFGPLLWAPLSESYGRKISILFPTAGLMIFSFATGAAKDIQTVMITRFFAGVFGSAPLCNVGGVLADIWPATQRGTALLVWGNAVIVGPLVAPIVGSALVSALDHTGWRWTEYLTGMLLAVVLVTGIIFIDETFPPVILARKANKIRFETKNWAIHSKSQEMDFSVREVCRKYLTVPLEMLVDPIAFFINLYAAFVYAIIYLTLAAFPIEFLSTRHWGLVLSSTPFLAILVGVVFASCINYWGQIYYNKRLVANGNKIIPEARLMPMMIGSFFFAGGLFIMGWTSKASVHWIGFCVGAACIGLGFFTIFQSSINYLVDTYLMLAASAIASNLFMRSALAAAFPLFARPMFLKLGLDWGMSLLGFFATAMIPIPFLFYIFGKSLRAKGKRSKVSFVP